MDPMQTVFQGLGMGLVACAVCWAALRNAGTTPSVQGVLFAKLLGVFMAIHLAALTLGGVNPVATGFATYLIGRWVFIDKPPVE